MLGGYGEMTDNEIIKALECCTEFRCEKCVFDDNSGFNCEENLMKYALDLINRKDAEIEKLNVELVGMRGACESYRIHYDVAQAEIERLREENKNQKLVIEEIEDAINPLPFETDFEKAIRIAKSEAIKEFTERLKELVTSITLDGRYGYDVATKECIDYLVKEMTEVSE
jgi:hypothetical protein